MTDHLPSLIESALSGDTLAVRALYDFALEHGRTAEEARAIGNRVHQWNDVQVISVAIDEPRIIGDIILRGIGLRLMVSVFANDPSPWLDAEVTKRTPTCLPC